MAKVCALFADVVTTGNANAHMAVIKAVGDDGGGWGMTYEIHFDTSLASTQQIHSAVIDELVTRVNADQGTSYTAADVHLLG